MFNLFGAGFAEASDRRSMRTVLNHVWWEWNLLRQVWSRKALQLDMQFPALAQWGVYESALRAYNQ